MAKCSWLTCNSEATHGEYCFQHARVYGNTKSEKKKQPLPKKSEKRKVEEKEYKKIVKEMLSENDRCELNVEGVCIKKASGLHHKKRRGKNYLNKEYLVRACNPCNGWVEENPLEAMKLGLVISKFKAA